jgi:hypothetical protein
MQTSRFQLALIATLAVGLGLSVASSQAIGYPAGAAVSKGSNPLWTVGGSVRSASSSDTPSTLLAAPSDQDMVLTDLSLGSTDAGAHPVALLLDDGTLLGYWIVHGTSGYEAGPQHMAFTSGIRIPAGSSLKLNPGIDSGRWVYYSLSGYYAQP